MTRKQAIETVKRAYKGADWATDRALVELTIDALDRAGAFPSEATEAEIASVARVVLNAEASERDNVWADAALWRNAALRLASACRAAGFCGKVRP